MNLSEIQIFYKEKIIFITGSTGLVGKTLVEKLLRSCFELDKIILTIRPKKNASAQDRIKEFFNDTLFNTIKKSNPEVIKKVVFLEANLDNEHCGFNHTDYEFVKTSVNIIFHCAATVDFNSPLKEAIKSNIKITKNIIDMARDMKQLQALIHVSTCWVHGYKKYTEEKVDHLTNYPEFFLNLLKNANEELMTKLTPTLLENWPNTYLLTKNVAEYQIEREKDNLPVTIFRSPAITPIYREPFPGWVNSIQIPTAIGTGLASGSIKVLRTELECNEHIVPADLVVNCMIAVAWQRALQPRNEELKVYNYSCVTNPLTRKVHYDACINTQYPLERTMWTPGYVATNKKWLFDKYFLMYHTIPAIISDTFLKMLGEKPIFIKMMKKINKMLNVSDFFLLHDLKLEFKNVPVLWNSLQPIDQSLFNFDVNSINWCEYLDIFNKSMKILLKEDFNKLDKCEERRYLLRCKY